MNTALVTGSIALLFSSIVLVLMGWLLRRGKSEIIAGYKRNRLKDEKIISMRVGTWIVIIGSIGICGIAVTILLVVLGFDEKLGDMVLFRAIPLLSIAVSMYVIFVIRKNMQ